MARLFTVEPGELTVLEEVMWAAGVAGAGAGGGDGGE